MLSQTNRKCACPKRPPREPVTTECTVATRRAHNKKHQTDQHTVDKASTVAAAVNEKHFVLYNALLSSVNYGKNRGSSYLGRQCRMAGHSCIAICCRIVLVVRFDCHTCRKPQASKQLWVGILMLHPRRSRPVLMARRLGGSGINERPLYRLR